MSKTQSRKVVIESQTFSSTIGLGVRVESILEKIALPAPLVARMISKSAEASDARIIFVSVGDPDGKDNLTGKPRLWWGRKWYISPHMTDSEIVQTVFLACKTAQEHELREQFFYKGNRIFDPHYDLDSLAELHRIAREVGE